MHRPPPHLIIFEEDTKTQQINTDTIMDNQPTKKAKVDITPNVERDGSHSNLPHAGLSGAGPSPEHEGSDIEGSDINRKEKRRKKTIRQKENRINRYYEKMLNSANRCAGEKVISYWGGDHQTGGWIKATQMSEIGTFCLYGSKKNEHDNGSLVKGAIAADSDGNYFIVEEERIRVSKNVWVGKHGGLPAKQLTGLISFPDGQKRYLQYWNEDFWCGLETEVTTHDAVRNRRILLRNDMSHNPGVEKMKNELSSPELLPKNVRALEEMFAIHSWTKTAFWERSYPTADIDRHIIEGNHHASFSLQWANHKFWIQKGGYLDPSNFHHNWVNRPLGLAGNDAGANEWGEQDNEILGRWTQTAARSPPIERELADKASKDLDLGEKTQFMLMFQCYDISLTLEKLRNNIGGEVKELSDAGISTANWIAEIRSYPDPSKSKGGAKQANNSKKGRAKQAKRKSKEKHICASCKVREVVRSIDLCNTCRSGKRIICIHCNIRKAQTTNHSCVTCAGRQICKLDGCERKSTAGYGLCRACRLSLDEKNQCPCCLVKLDSSHRCVTANCNYTFKVEANERCKTDRCHNKVSAYGLCRGCRERTKKNDECPVCGEKMNHNPKCSGCGYSSKIKTSTV